MHKYVLSDKPIRRHPIHGFLYYNLFVPLERNKSHMPSALYLIYGKKSTLKMVNLKEASKLLNVHRTTVLRYIHAGVFVNVFRNCRKPREYLLFEMEVEEVKMYLRDFGHLNRLRYKDLIKQDKIGTYTVCRPRVGILYKWGNKTFLQEV